MKKKDMKIWLTLKPEKNSGLNGIPTHDLCDTSVVLYQLSYYANNWELAGYLVSSYISVESEGGRSYIHLHSAPSGGILRRNL